MGDLLDFVPYVSCKKRIFFPKGSCPHSEPVPHSEPTQKGTVLGAWWTATAGTKQANQTEKQGKNFF